MPSTAARVIYPELPDPLTPGDVQRLFSPSYSERGWAPTIARRPESQVALLVHLKIFQTIGRFLPAAQIPPIVVERVALKMGARCANPMVGTKRTLHRYRAAILQHLGVASWLGNGRGIALEAMQAAARMRVDPADIINAAIEALVQHRIELPPLAVLRRLAGTAHNQINRAQWAAVSHRLPVVQRDALDALLVVDAKTQKSAFSVLCTHPGRPSRKNLDALVERYEWLMQLPDPAPALRDVADAKVMLWANEARRLNALELRGYVSTRRHVLLLASIRAARGQVLDELTHMLLRLARKIEHRSQQLLAEWYQARHGRTDQLIRALRDALIAHDRALDAPEKVAQMEAVFVSHGGHESLVKDCDAHLRHERQNWRPFARAVFVPFRVTLLRLARLLPMHTARACGDVLLLVSAITDGINTPAYLSIEGVPPRTVPREWGALVHDHPNDPLTFNRRQLEVVAVLELASAIRAGEVFVLGSQSFDRFWDRVPIEATTPAAIEAYAASHGWDGGAEGFVRILKRNLDQQAMFLDRAVGSGDQAYLQRGRHGRPVVARLSAVGTPETAIALEEDLMAQMPERPVLEALSNTEHWAKWGRHFGPPSRQGPQLREAHRRYVFTAFAYGCGLGPTEAARHLSAAVSADQLAFADRRHIDITDLRAASADLVNLYARFELPQQWGGGASAAADGTHFETHEDNLLAEQHIRYGKTGGIAYRHVADNYIALFSRLIACGTYEATYILDALFENLSELRPVRVHADTHGQSAAVFGLAYLLGIELMPRIRRWHKLAMYRSDTTCRYEHIGGLFTRTVNWHLIRQHYDQFMQLALAIQSGAVAPSAVLSRANSYSTRDQFAWALKELGNAVRTTYLLGWVMDESLRRTVHKGTTKIERHHKFAKHLAFGAGGHLRSNNVADQEKAIVYNELVANAVALQNVVDQTQALHTLKSQGVDIRTADLAFLSPYATSKLKRFGDYPTQLNPEPLPTLTTVPHP
jgi:TnpA family transposase